MRVFPIMAAGVSIALLCAPTPGHTQDAAGAVAAMDYEEMERLADIARDGTDARITASMKDESGRTDKRTTDTPPVLISIAGEPAFVYTRGADFSIPEGDLEFVMRCRGGGVMDISVILTHGMAGVWDGLVPGKDYELRIDTSAKSGYLSLPVRLAEIIPSYQTIVRMNGTTATDSAFFKALGPSTRLSYQLFEDGAVTRDANGFVPMVGGVSSATFRTAIYPLMEHCAAGHANPMDRDLPPLEPGNDLLGAAVQDPPPVTADLSFLPQKTQRSFSRLLAGRPRSSVASLRAPLLTYIAFHAAFWEQCGATSNLEMDFYSMTPFRNARTIGVPKEDYETLVVAATAFEPVSRSIYNDAVRNDFSFSETRDRIEDGLERDVKTWRQILWRNGCDGEVEAAFRQAVARALPYLEYTNGRRQILLDFGDTEVNAELSVALRIDLARKIGRAERDTPDQTIFTDSYPGQVLRNIAIGNFARIDRLEADLNAQISNPFQWEESIMTQFLELAMQVNSMFQRQSNLITAYAIARFHILGSCGEPITPYSQTEVYWTEYRNGLGQTLYTGNEGTRTDYADVPSKFDPVIRRQNSIKSGGVLAGEMTRIIVRMTCDSPVRDQLERNMLAYFARGTPPVIAALPGR